MMQKQSLYPLFHHGKEHPSNFIQPSYRGFAPTGGLPSLKEITQMVFANFDIVIKKGKLALK
jgi:hypothetical protein